ncbi:MAG: glycosyltransferase, partial [Gemmatimonadales bacterium]
MRVVFLTHNYPRWPGDYSGAALATLARALLRRGVSVRVVALGEDAAERAEQDGILIRRVRISSRVGQSIFDQDAFAARLRSPRRWGLLLRLWRGLSLAAEREVSAGADLVHAHWWMPSGLATPARVPQVLTLQGTDAGLIRTSRLARAAARRLLGRTSLITAVSRSIGETVQNLTGRFVGTEHIHPLPIESRGRPWTRGGSGAVV